MPFSYLSLCSGIEAATVAWEPLGWIPAAFAEIEKFPSALLAHYYPSVPNLGDITKISGKDFRGKIDLIVGGSPCQAYSVAGLRRGLDDPRGRLTLEFFRIAGEARPPWLIWENVPGVLSIDSGRTFGTVLGTLAKLGYGFAYRILDAQHWGIPQRRRRVILVGYFGDWRPAAAVLFERHCLSGDTPPRRKTGQEIAGTFTSRSQSGGWSQDIDLAAGGYMQIAKRLATQDVLPISYVAHTLRGEGFDGSEDGTGRANLLPISFMAGQGAKAGSVAASTCLSPTLKSAPSGTNMVPSVALIPNIRGRSEVRRLTPKECERLQGFPDNYTLIPWRGKPAELCPDGPRYKALGNSMAVPVMRWLGERTNFVENIMAAQGHLNIEEFL